MDLGGGNPKKGVEEEPQLCHPLQLLVMDWEEVIFGSTEGQRGVEPTGSSPLIQGINLGEYGGG